MNVFLHQVQYSQFNWTAICTQNSVLLGHLPRTEKEVHLLNWLLNVAANFY